VADLNGTRNGACTPTRLWPPGTLLAVLEPTDLDVLLRYGIERQFIPNERLIIQGDSATGVFLLLRGWVKVVGDSADGHAVLLSIRTSGDVVGELAALDNMRRSASVIAVTHVTARAIPQAQFLALLTARPALALAVSRSIAAKMRLATQHRIDVSGVAVLRRVARVLAYLADSYSSPCSEGLRIEVPLSRADLAALVGAAEPSLYRAIASLRARGVLVTRNRRQVVRDLPLLKEIADGTDVVRGG
jgi:CRP/FNR family transcriptional regulator, cyclic AMP receptor protein